MVRGLGRAIVWDHARPNQIRFGKDAKRDGLASQRRGILAALQGREGTRSVPAIVPAESSKRCWTGCNGEDPRDAEAETAKQSLGVQNP